MIKRENGFTLVETIIVVAIFSMLVLILYNLYSSSIKILNKVETVLKEYREVELFEYRIRDDINKSIKLLYNDSRGITLWIDDKNSDKIPENNELAAYYYDNRNIYRIADNKKEIVLSAVSQLEWKINNYPEGILIDLRFKNKTKDYWIVTKKY